MAAITNDSKLIIASGTDNGTGATCILNYVAVELAKYGSVLLIEFKRKTGFSIYMHRGHAERRRSLTEVINIPEKLSENVIKSPHRDTMYYLCMNLYEDCLKLQEYQGYKIIDIVKEAKKIFDYVILDLPSDPTEPAVGVAYGRDLVYKPDHTLLFVDERVSSFKYLNDFNAILNIAGETTPRDTTFVINKVATAHYQEYIEDYLPSLPLTKPANKVWLPYLPDLITATNKGNIYETGVNADTKFFFAQIDELASIIRDNKRGVNLSRATLEKQMTKQPSKGLFGSLFSKKVSVVESHEEKAEHNRKVDEQFAIQDEQRRLLNESLFEQESYDTNDLDKMVMVRQDELSDNPNPDDDEVLIPAQPEEGQPTEQPQPTDQQPPQKEKRGLFGGKSKDKSDKKEKKKDKKNK